MKYKQYFLVLLFALCIISCEEEKNTGEQNIALDEIIGEWNSEMLGGYMSDNSFFVFASDYSYIAYLHDEILQAGHYSYDEKNNTITAVSAFDQSTTIIKVSKDGNFRFFDINYYSPSLKKECSTGSQQYFRGKEKITTVFDYMFIGKRYIMWEQTSYNILGPGEILTNIQYSYYFDFANNFLGSFTKYKHYTKISGKDEYNGFDFHYVYWNNKLYLIGFSDNNTYSKPFKQLCNNNYIKVVPFIVDTTGKVTKWTKKEIAEDSK